MKLKDLIKNIDKSNVNHPDLMELGDREFDLYDVQWVNDEDK